MKFEYLVERAVPKYGIYDPELGNPASLTLLTPLVGCFFGPGVRISSNDPYYKMG